MWVLSNFRLIAKGREANVYCTVDRLTRTTHAIKVYSILSASFQREAHVSSLLPKHPHILTVTTTWIEPTKGLAILVMPYRSFTLRMYLKYYKVPRNPDWVRMIIIQLLQAVQHAHSHGIIHADLKPENIVMKTADHLEVIDWGSAIRITQTDQIVRYHGPIQTGSYRAPEVKDKCNFNSRIDVYSIGCIFNELQSSHTESSMDLWKRLCATDPRDRISTDRALHHPYLAQPTKSAVK